MWLRELDLSKSRRLDTETVYLGPHVSQEHSSHFKGTDERLSMQKSADSMTGKISTPASVLFW